MISASDSDYDVKSFKASWTTHLHLVGRGRNAGERGDEALVYADAPQEDAFVQELVVIMQQDRREVYRRKPNSRNANLKARIKPITRLRTGGMRQNEWFLLTALMKRLSVAAGKISFSRDIFLHLENNKRLWISNASYSLWTLLSQNCTHIEEPDQVQQVKNVYKRTFENKIFLDSTSAAKASGWFSRNIFLHANAWRFLCDSDVTLHGAVQFKPLTLLLSCKYILIIRTFVWIVINCFLVVDFCWETLVDNILFTQQSAPTTF